MVYKFIYTDDGERDLVSKVPIPATLQTCRQFYKEALPSMHYLHTCDLTVHRDGVKYHYGPNLKSSLTAPSRIQRMRLIIHTHPMGVGGGEVDLDLDRDIERVEIHL